MRRWLRRLLIKLLRRLLHIEAPRDYIREPRIKIDYNPFGHGYRACRIDRWNWVRLNPKTHMWEWKRKPTPAEAIAWGAQPPDVIKNGMFHREEFDVEEREKPMPCDQPYTCQFCNQDSPCNEWNQDVCPKCGKVYDQSLLLKEINDELN